MANVREVVIVNGTRTAIGDYGGSLKDIPPTELGARVVREAVSRAGVDPAQVGQCVFGHVIHTEAKDMYLARVAGINGGLAHESGALTLNRLCGSGLQAIVSAAQYIMLGDVDAAIGWEHPDGSRAHRLAGEAVDDNLAHPDRIAELYWQLHRQHRSTWAFEVVLRPWKENC